MAFQIKVHSLEVGTAFGLLFRLVHALMHMHFHLVLSHVIFLIALCTRLG